MIVNGWTLLFYDAFSAQFDRLSGEVARARSADPRNYKSKPSAKLFAALSTLAFETIPADPARPEYRQGNTLGPDYRAWFRVKFLGRFRLFFRYDSQSRVIVYAWVNDERTLRQSGGRNDPYEVFRRMLKSGNPPNDWAALLKSARAGPRPSRSSGS
jgi:toxin YhaV